jgi:hypothetical protein
MKTKNSLPFQQDKILQSRYSAMELLVLGVTLSFIIILHWTDNFEYVHVWVVVVHQQQP